MFKQNVLLFLRNIRKNKTSFLINTIGLGLGVASFVLLALYIQNDMSYNRFHRNLDNIYRVREGNMVQTKGLLLPKILEEIPEVENGTRIFDWDGQRISYGELAFFENIKHVDPGFFSIFSFPFKEGLAQQNPIADKYGVVISSQVAKKYFGDGPAVGEKLQLNFDNVYLTVNGVVDIPPNSSITFDIVSSYETGEEIMPWMKEVHDWYNTFSYTYVQLGEGIAPVDIQDKLQRIVKENFEPVGKSEAQLNLLPFKDYHAVVESNRTLIIILSIIALGILGVAFSNFINLTITGSLTRIREIGIKKVHGATRQHLVGQITTEAFLNGFVAMLLGLFLAKLALPTFNGLFDTQLEIHLFENPVLGPILVVVWAVMGLISGWVPSQFWSRGKLVNNLQGTTFPNQKMGSARYSSIILQFVIAIILISGTLLIQKQIGFMMEKDPKFDKDNVITAQTDYWQFEDQEKASQSLRTISEELASSPYIASVGFSGVVPGMYQENYNNFYPQGGIGAETLFLKKAYVGENYFKTYGIPLLNGTGFEKGSVSKENTVVLNKTAMEKLGVTQATGQVLREGSQSGAAYRIIGVVDDFSYQGIQTEIQPLAHFYTEQENSIDWDYMSIRAQPGASLQAIGLLKEKWEELLPEASLTYFFADDKLDAYYKEYQKINKLIIWFSLLAIALSGMGLFAVSAYVSARRTKEIGIRKVNGATIAQIMALLNKGFIKWVALAFIIAVPISWYAMTKWLEGFAYKTPLSAWIYIIAGLIVLGITLITVSWQSLKAARTNPSEILRSE